MIPFYRTFSAASGKISGEGMDRRRSFASRLKCLFNRHPKSELHVQRIRIHEKKNKAPEYFLQGRAVCTECGRVIEEAYLRN